MDGRLDTSGKCALVAAADVAVDVKLMDGKSNIEKRHPWINAVSRHPILAFWPSLSTMNP
jgi:hypothetical protein